MLFDVTVWCRVWPDVLHEKCPTMCPKFWHILDIILDIFLVWTFFIVDDTSVQNVPKINYLWTLNFLKKSFFNVSKHVSKLWAHYGHILDISLWFGHVSCAILQMSKQTSRGLDTFRALWARLDMFWTSVGHILGFGHIFGHIMDTFGDFASKMCPSLHRAPVPSWR